MNKHKILIYDFHELFIILEEIKELLNLEVEELLNIKDLKNINIESQTNLIVSKVKISENFNYLLLNNFPIKVKKLVEKFNIEYLKQKFIYQSEIKIGKYIINLNSRELILGNRNLKLTEKEVNIINYLSKFNKPKKIEELQIKVWGYHSELETHTVETHIYRLRKKIFNYFNDDNFIMSKKNGYQIS
jgi:hypothetical protein